MVLEKESQIDAQGPARDRHGLRRHGRSRSAQTCDVHTAAFRGRSDWRGGRASPQPADSVRTRWTSLMAHAAGRAHGLLGSGVRALREVLCLPPGLPDVLLRALHRGQEPAHGDRHLGHRRATSPGTSRAPFTWPARCVGCGECTRACPAGSTCGLLNLSLAKAAEEHFGLSRRHGPQGGTADRRVLAQDKEDFIR